MQTFSTLPQAPAAPHTATPQNSIAPFLDRIIQHDSLKVM